MKRQLFVAWILLLSAIDAQACRFVARPWADLFGGASAAFIGTVATSSNGRSGRPPDIPGVFIVERVWSGALVPGQRVAIATSNNSCGLSFVAGQEWLILASDAPLRSDAPNGSLLLVSETGAVQADNQRFVRGLTQPSR